MSHANAEKHGKFCVIIAGGGIAGLTLANALQHCQIDYLLLEARPEIAPQLGASIGLAPNGSRILDQLSCYDDIDELAEPVQSVGYHDSQGNELCPRSDGFQLFQTRTNYPVCFLDRQKVLQILADHIHEPRRILLNKKVTRVDHHPDRVVVHCVDGTSYTGDLLVGADGASSKVRSEMWQAAGEEITQKEQAAMTAEYQCLFGISSDISQILPGHLDITHKKDVSTIVIGGKGNRVFWFLFVKLPQTYQHKDIPRFTTADADQLASQHLDLCILPNAAVTFGHLWKCRITATLQSLEEADYPVWTWGRFACVGDSAHKMTPNMGSGGMMAIESTAALANALHGLLDKKPNPSLADVQQAMAQFQMLQKPRASKLVKASNELTRVQAVKSLKEHIIVHWLLPYIGPDLLIDSISDNWVGAPLLSFLPPPRRSVVANMSLDRPPKPPGVLYKTLAALLFLFLSLSCFNALLQLIPFSQLDEILTRTHKITWGQSEWFPIWNRFYHISALDELARPATVLFAPSSFGYDPLSRLQMITFMADIGLVYAIMLVESTRRANSMSPIKFPFLFGMLSFRGIGFVLPLYCFLYVLTCPTTSLLRASDSRLTDMSYTSSILPVLLLSYYAPYGLAYFGVNETQRHVGIWLWHLFPLWASLGQWVLKSLRMTPNTLRQDRLQRPVADAKAIRVTIAVLTAVSAGVYLYCVTCDSQYSLMDIFVPNSGTVTVSRTAGTGRNVAMGFEEAIRTFLQWDQVYFAAALLLWVVYLFAELKRSGAVPRAGISGVPHWTVVVVGVVCSSLAIGTGAAASLAWLWREEVLIRRATRAQVKYAQEVR